MLSMYVPVSLALPADGGSRDQGIHFTVNVPVSTLYILYMHQEAATVAIKA